ncbi:MAG TPA: hypothetical protein PLV87_14395, partial [Opitutaceae bacterium]|nr:hypothetical protein [Opitutaceae bacterium]
MENSGKLASRRINWGCVRNGEIDMAHHAQNRLVIECEPKDYALVRALLAGEEEQGQSLSFQALAPVTASEDSAVLRAAQAAAWGVTGGAYDIMVEETPNGLVYWFHTAWRNVPWIAQAVVDLLRGAGIALKQVCYEG